MSGTTWLYSDPHFGHHKMACVFEDEHGQKIRPFKDAAHQDMVLWTNWKLTVGPKDKIYVLGDVAIPKKSLVMLEDLPGDKVLIMGNHDVHGWKAYTKYFRDIRAYHVMDKCVLSHVPLSKANGSRWRANIHGHTHQNLLPDPWYVNVCVEHTQYAPIAWDTVREEIARRERTIQGS